MLVQLYVEIKAYAKINFNYKCTIWYVMAYFV